MPMCEHTGPGECPNPFHRPMKSSEIEEVSEQNPDGIHDLGESSYQILMQAGLNVFAIDLLTESYVRSHIPELGPIRFTIQTRKQSGSPEKVPVRLTLELL